jgi:hypothetical protein
VITRSVSVSADDANPALRHSNACISLPPQFYCAAFAMLLLSQRLHDSMVQRDRISAHAGGALIQARCTSAGEFANTLCLLHWVSHKSASRAFAKKHSPLAAAAASATDTNGVHHTVSSADDDDVAHLASHVDDETAFLAALILCWMRYAEDVDGSDNYCYYRARWTVLLSDMRSLQAVKPWLGSSVSWRTSGGE